MSRAFVRPRAWAAVVVQDPVSGSYSSAPEIAAHQHRAIRQQRRRRRCAGPDISPVAVQVPVAGSYSSGSVRPAPMEPAGSEHLAVGQQREGDGGAPVAHGRRRGPGPRGRIVQLGRFLNAVDGVTELVIDVAARHEHPAIGQQDGGVADVVPLGHPPGGGPGPAVGVVQLGAVGCPSRAPCRRAATWLLHPWSAMIIFPVAVQVPLAGSYTSAPRFQRASSSAFGSSPSPTSTLPSRSNVAGKPARGLTMFPVADQVPVAGSYNSAEVSFSSPLAPPHDQAPGHRGAARRCGQSGACPSSRWRSRRPLNAGRRTGVGRRVALGVELGATTPGRLGLGSPISGWSRRVVTRAPTTSRRRLPPPRATA